MTRSMDWISDLTFCCTLASIEVAVDFCLVAVLKPSLTRLCHLSN